LLDVRKRRNEMNKGEGNLSGKFAREQKIVRNKQSPPLHIYSSSALSLRGGRQQWRGPAFFAVVLFGSNPPPFPPATTVGVARYLCSFASLVQLPCPSWVESRGKDPSRTTAKAFGPLILFSFYNSSSMCIQPPSHQLASTVQLSWLSHFCMFTSVPHFYLFTSVL
jgi:hypothetical protein